MSDCLSEGNVGDLHMPGCWGSGTTRPMRRRPAVRSQPPAPSRTAQPSFRTLPLRRFCLSIFSGVLFEAGI